MYFPHHHMLLDIVLQNPRWLDLRCLHQFILPLLTEAIAILIMSLHPPNDNILYPYRKKSLDLIRDWLWVRSPLEELNLYFHSFPLVFRQSVALNSANQHATPPEFNRKWGTECLYTRFLLSCCVRHTAWSWLS